MESPRGNLDRRDVLRLAALSAAAGVASGLPSFLAGCEKRDARPAVTLYTSVDAGIVEPILRSIDAPSTNFRWRIAAITDTEATKTTGLVTRLVNEKAAPKADLWWSGEIIGSIQLARRGILAPLASDIVSRRFSQAPQSAVDAKNRWFPIAYRPRVLVFNTAKVPESSRPRTLADVLTQSRTIGPICVANPAFGTTRGHFAALLAALGTERFTKLLEGGRFRVVDSNSAVVRAVGAGECVMGLTDYDDVISGLANNWPIAPGALPWNPDEHTGPTLMTPGTIGLVAGGPNTAGAAELAEALLTARVERALAASAWRSIPTVHAPGDEGIKLDTFLAPLTIAPVNWERAVDVLDQAVELSSRILTR